MAAAPAFVDQQSLRSLAMGAAVLSAGGGSFPYLEYLSAVELIGGHPIPLLDVQALPDDALVAIVGMAGAPLALLERFVDPEHFVRPVRTLERYLGKTADVIMGVEIGSTNGIVPVIVAASTQLPLLDADTFGRSWPQANMTSFALAGIPMTPLVLSDIRANEVIITYAIDGLWTEQILRGVTTTFGSIASTCRACTGAMVKRHGIAGTYSRALRLGAAILGAQAEHFDVIADVLESEGGILLARGKVVDVERRVTQAFVRGEARIAPTDGGPPVSLLFQNEYSVVKVGGRPQCTVPDLICVFDTVRGEPLGTEALRYGQQVALVSLPAMTVHLTPAAMKVVGPRGFGYDFDYVSPHRGSKE
jgi:uncharacterized protein